MGVLNCARFVGLSFPDAMVVKKAIQRSELVMVHRVTQPKDTRFNSFTVGRLFSNDRTNNYVKLILYYCVQ